MTRFSEAVESVARRVLPARPALATATKIAGRRGAGLALLYHRVGVEENGTPRIVPTLAIDVFRRHLEVLGNVGEIVPLRQLLQAPDRHGTVRFAITFDDDNPNYVQDVLPVLQELGVHATFFLSGRSLHGAGAYPWESIEEALTKYGVERVGEMLDLPGAGPAELAAVCQSSSVDDRVKTLVGKTGPHPMTKEHIRALADTSMDIGFHTVHHPVLTELPPDKLDRVLREGRQELSAAAGKPVNLFSYPFGLANRQVADRVRLAGFDAAFTTRSHAIGQSSHRFLLGRWETRRRNVDEFVTALTLRLVRPGTGPSAAAP